MKNACVARCGHRAFSTSLLIAVAMLISGGSAQSAPSAFDAAHAAQSRGDYQNAIRLYGEALQSGRLESANQARAYLNRGSAHAVTGKLSEAAHDFDAAVRLMPNDVVSLVNRGTTRVLLGQPRAAYADFNAAHHLEPRDAYASLWLEITRLRLNEPDRGALRKTATLRKPDRWPHPIVKVFLGQADPGSLEMYTLEPTRPQGSRKRCEAAFFLGQLALHRKQLADAQDWLTKATQWCPQSFIEFIAARTELQELAGPNPPQSRLLSRLCPRLPSTHLAT